MHVHILGIAGTFMAGIARLARESGHTVTGSDSAVYPPMSTQLEALGIDIVEGYTPESLPGDADLFVIGNVMSRGNPAVEYILNQRLPYESGPAWLAREVLPGRHVLAVAGTHGKTTTTSILAYLLDRAGLEPGFMIGGVPECFGVSARRGTGEHFVIEADEYDTAFFDKRSKFVHYRPSTLVLNNLEFDHADIFPDLDAIKWQFHQLLRCVPANGRLLVRDGDAALDALLDMGCWTPLTRFGTDGGDWRITDGDSDCTVTGPEGAVRIETQLLGTHNRLNLVAAVAAAAAVGVAPEQAARAMPAFRGPRRRLELLAQARGIRIYDDFAHHPTAIAATLAALAPSRGGGRLIALLEPRSNTMRMGVHAGELAAATAAADRVLVLEPPGLDWDLAAALGAGDGRCSVFQDSAALEQAVSALMQPGDCIVCMSNGSFDALPRRLAAQLAPS